MPSADLVEHRRYEHLEPITLPSGVRGSVELRGCVWTDAPFSSLSIRTCDGAESPPRWTLLARLRPFTGQRRVVRHPIPPGLLPVRPFRLAVDLDFHASKAADPRWSFGQGASLYWLMIAATPPRTAHPGPRQGEPAQ
jgi:hypothetical protein